MKFNYFRDIRLDEDATSKISFIYRPYIPIRLSSSHQLSKYPVLCLVDSGADKNLFPSGWAESVGIKIKSGKLKEHIGIGGVSVLAYRHTIRLYVGSYGFTTEADFSDQQQLPLLGREGFFNFFKKVSFDEQDKTIELEHK